MAGIYHASRDRYELPFDAETVNCITLSRFPGNMRKDIRDEKDIQKIISSFQALRVYPWEETELLLGNENMRFIFHLTDGNEEVINYSVDAKNKGSLYDKTGKAKVTYLPVYDLWDRLEAREYESTELKLISIEESQTIEKITALYSNGIKTAITDSDTLQKIALELRENLTIQDITSDWKNPKENSIHITLLVKNGHTIEFEYFPEYILSDRIPDARIILELPTLRDTLKQEMNAEI